MNYESLIILPGDKAGNASQHIITPIKNDSKQQKEVGGLLILITTSQSHLSSLTSALGKVKKVI